MRSVRKGGERFNSVYNGDCMRFMLVGLSLLLAQAAPPPSPEQRAYYAVSKSFDQPDKIDATLLDSLSSSGNFGARYVALLTHLHKVAGTGAGGEATHVKILALAKLDPKATDHLQALAASFKKALYCQNCKNGEVECGKCKGKGRIDLTCPECNGKGRVPAPGARLGTNVTQRCNPCNTTGVFKGTACPDCSKSGQIACSTCGGRPWREVRCSAGCKAGRVVCPDCKGTAKLYAKCMVCNGAGKVPEPNKPKAMMRCRPCDGKGTVVNDRENCLRCKGSPVGLGHLRCETCKGDKNSGARVASASDIFSKEPCAACGGAGWPQGEAAAPCPKCLGLGSRIKPASDPSKLLE